MAGRRVHLGLRRYALQFVRQDGAVSFVLDGGFLVQVLRGRILLLLALLLLRLHVLVLEVSAGGEDDVLRIQLELQLLDLIVLLRNPV